MRLSSLRSLHNGGMEAAYVLRIQFSKVGSVRSSDWS